MGDPVSNTKKHCEHMKKVFCFMKRNDIDIDACGCCGSPWVTCNKCNITVDDYGGLSELRKSVEEGEHND